ncbi:MAG: ABC transporter ATP-binding protein [Actinobacteria bacterium]|nr:MAG: ABC transporter ATP-binding protein [Actinomycetota bacterium]
MAEPVVQIKGVSRAFANVVALDNFDLEVPQGTVTALLGPNGAGKTTTVRVITGGLKVSGGSVKVFGLDPYREGEAVRKRCGVVSAKPALYDRLNGWDNLRYAAELFGLGENARIGEAAARFGIRDALDFRVGTYSTGMKTRLALARAVLHDPQLLLLDEPTAGLDPESARAVLALIDEMATGGKTVLLCTHLLLEAEGLADQVVVMDQGHALIAGPPAELSKRFWPNLVVLLDAEDRETLDEAKIFEGVLGYERNGHATIQIDDLARIPNLIAYMSARGVRLTRVEPHVPTLEDLYFAVRNKTRPAVFKRSQTPKSTEQDR